MLARSLAVLLLAVALTPPAPAQGDILYYKFDEAGGAKVVNYAGGTMAPAEGTIVTTDTAAFAPGHLGQGSLRGSQTGGPSVYTFVESGGLQPFTGSFTVAWFLKARNPPPSGVNYWFGSNLSGSLFRGYSGGSLAGNSLLVRTWGGAPADLKSATDIISPALSAWVHVALVVDATAGTATFYVDGMPEPPIPISGSATVPALSTFRVNAYTQTAGNSVFDMDEFRLVNRAVPANEMFLWARVSWAADAAFGKGCGATLSSSGGPPRFGNATYALTVNAAPNAPWALALGTSRLRLGAVPLPFDLGTILPALSGCSWESSAEVVVGGTTNAAGTALVPVPIPPGSHLVAAALYAQALIVAPAAQTSNPFALSLGQ